MQKDEYIEKNYASDDGFFIAQKSRIGFYIGIQNLLGTLNHGSIFMSPKDLPTLIKFLQELDKELNK